MKITDLARLLEKGSSIEHINQCMTQYFSCFGIRYFAFTYYCKYPSSRLGLKFEYASKSLKPWHQYYIESGYADSDGTLQQMTKAILPHWWDIKKQLAVAKTTKERRIREESLEFNLAKGVSIPVHGVEGDFATLTLHQAQDESGLDDHKDDIAMFFLAAYHYYSAIRPHIEGVDQTDELLYLTRRERQCLTLTAKHHTTEEIAARLKIKIRTVHFHLQNASKKLGVTSKHQATLKWMTSQKN